MGRSVYRINLLESERKILEQLIRRQSTPQNIVKRARIIWLVNGEGRSNQAVADQLGIWKPEVTCWLKRWIDRAMEPLEERLQDFERSGRPSAITAEQWCRIVALACEPPEQYGRPITHWTSRELRDEAVQQGIVEALSPRHLRRVLKKRRCSPIAVATG